MIPLRAQPAAGSVSTTGPTGTLTGAKQARSRRVKARKTRP
jgi:hypothetical protein